MCRLRRGHLHAYEPAPNSAALLRRNLEVNGVANVTVFEEAVAGRRGEVFLDQDVPEAVMFKLAVDSSGERGGSVAAMDTPDDDAAAVVRRYTDAYNERAVDTIVHLAAIWEERA